MKIRRRLLTILPEAIPTISFDNVHCATFENKCIFMLELKRLISNMPQRDQHHIPKHYLFPLVKNASGEALLLVKTNILYYKSATITTKPLYLLKQMRHIINCNYTTPAKFLTTIQNVSFQNFKFTT